MENQMLKWGMGSELVSEAWSGFPILCLLLFFQEVWGLETESKRICVLGPPISDHPSIRTHSPISWSHAFTLNILITDLELVRSTIRTLVLIVGTHTLCSKTKANQLGMACSLSHNCRKRPTDLACGVTKKPPPSSTHPVVWRRRCQQGWYLHDACVTVSL